jgi:hypothetical protein
MWIWPGGPSKTRFIQSSHGGGRGALTKQKLSRKAAAAKKARDIAAAKTPARRAKKAENQSIGQRKDSDLHHTKSGSVVRVSVKNNRGNFGKGTRNE